MCMVVDLSVLDEDTDKRLVVVDPVATADDRFTLAANVQEKPTRA